MFVAVTMAGVFGMTGTLFLLLHRAVFGEKMRMSQRMDHVLGEKEVPIRKQELSAPLYQRMFRPVLGKSANLVLAVIPFTREADLDKKVMEAGRPGNLNAREWMVIKTLLALAFAGLCWIFFQQTGRPVWQAVMMMVPLFFVGWFIVDSWLSGRVRRRRDEVQRALPDLLDLLTVSVEAGLGFEGALMKIVEKTNGLLSDEFLTVLRETKMGKSRRDALKDMAARLNVDSLSNFVGSIVLAEQLGISIGNVLRIQSKEMRQKKRQRAEETAMKAPIKMLIPMVMFIFPAIFIVLLGPAVLQIMRVFQ
ncbi:type II secretion system F family protein [Anoxynatronum sibiricum]|uniref:Type II secretion system F family protein n=1 Tax=Anoxynatronum sibiricum TaxID=210623 RepID=A0ABU9VVV5_9CLOT